MLIDLFLGSIDGILGPFLGLLDKVFSVTQLDNLLVYLTEYTDLIFKNAVKIAPLFMDLEFTLNILTLVLAIETMVGTYNLFMWVIKKIPLINIH